MTDDLTYISTDALMAELRNRHDSGIIFLVKDRDDTTEERHICYFGSPLVLIGIATYIETTSIESLKADNEEAAEQAEDEGDEE